MAKNESFVTTGFEEPYVAEYSFDETTEKVTYTNGQKLGRGVDVSLDLDESDGDAFYADDIAAETDAGQFVSGTANVTVDGLEAEAANCILGIPLPAEGKDEMYYADGFTAPYVGLGYLVRQQYKGNVWYRVHVLLRVKFSIPGESAETSTDSINWQTQELSAAIERTEEPKTVGDKTIYPWKKIITTKFPTKAAALARLKTELGIGA